VIISENYDRKSVVATSRRKTAHIWKVPREKRKQAYLESWVSSVTTSILGDGIASDHKIELDSEDCIAVQSTDEFCVVSHGSQPEPGRI
jgi:hypothetical protein